ncbi:hypothetical protein [Brevibacillus migulae]|uniref:hypothetical protein n=1 Tax=Brevibacillus migulae TaxID=1644114 RepID=UPI0014301723|nr:hypothetical protein [Brevibacillus migulae]
MSLGNEDKSKRPEMGYDGSNMHGYSLSKKTNSLSKYAGNGTVEPEKQGEKVNELG